MALITFVKETLYDKNDVVLFVKPESKNDIYMGVIHDCKYDAKKDDITYTIFAKSILYLNSKDLDNTPAKKEIISKPSDPAVISVSVPEKFIFCKLTEYLLNWFRAIEANYLSSCPEQLEKDTNQLHTL